MYLFEFVFILSRVEVTTDGGFDWCLYLFTTWTPQDSELQVITAPPLLSTIHKSPQHPLRNVPACCVFVSHSLATASNSGDSSASRAHVLSSQPPVRNCLITQSQSHSHIATDSQSWCRAPSGAHDQIFSLLLDSYGRVFVGRPL
jgi:hypothetical protein